MAVEFIEGFDHYTAGTWLTQKWVASSNVKDFQPGRYTGRAARLLAANKLELGSSQIAASSTRSVGFAMRLQGSPDAPVYRPLVLQNGWGNNAHVGAYEMGVAGAHNWGLNDDTTEPYNAPEYAVDANPATAANIQYEHTHKYAGCIWSFHDVAAGMPATVYPLRIKILSEANSSYTPSRSAGIWYTLNGGTTWTMIYDEATRAKTWDTITLPPTADISQLQIMAFTDSHDDQSHFVYDIYLDTATPFLTYLSGTTPLLSLCAASDKSLVAVRPSDGAILGATSSGLLQAGIWYHLESQVVFNTTTGGTALFLWGLPVMAVTNVNTGSAACDGIRLYGFGLNSVSESTKLDYALQPTYYLEDDMSVGGWVRFPANANGTIIAVGGPVNGIYSYSYGSPYAYLVYVLPSTSGSGFDLHYVHDSGRFPSLSDQEATWTMNIPADTWVYFGLSRDSSAQTITAYVSDGSTITAYDAVAYTSRPGNDAESQSPIFTIGGIYYQGTDYPYDPSAPEFDPGASRDSEFNPSIMDIASLYLWDSVLSESDHLASAAGSPPSALLSIPNIGDSSLESKTGTMHTAVVPGAIPGPTGAENTARAFGHVTTGYMLVDDVFVTDGDVLGDCSVQTKFPSADGAYVDWTAHDSAGHTSHFIQVDDPDPDGDTTYIDAQDDGATDTYEFPPVSADLGIVGVQVTRVESKLGAAALSTTGVFKSVLGTLYEAPTTHTPSSSYALKRDIWAVDPATGEAWTELEVNTGEFGVKLDG